MATLVTEREQTPPPPPSSSRGLGIRRWHLVVGVLVVWVVAGFLLQGKATQDLPTSQLTDFQLWLNDLRDFIQQAKFDGNPFFVPIDWASDALTWVVEWLQRLFVEDRARTDNAAQIGWAGVVALAVWLGYALAGTRIAIIVAVSMLAFGFLGLWEESLDTLIVTGVSVVICVVIGLPLGIWMARSKRATTMITPVLDIMQTMPSFAYLTPLVLIFGIGIPGAVAATLIYALPPLVRISAHGLRSVAPTTVEATTAMGSTSTQLLGKVQLPMARRTIIVGLNQTIMAALSMATIAAIIDGPGLGQVILRALTLLNVGVAFVAGLCIVIMAIMLDRSAVAAGARSEVAARARTNPNVRRLALLVGGVAAVAVVYQSHVKLPWAIFPDSTWGETLSRWTNDVTNSFVDTFGQLTRWINNFVTDWVLNPLQDLLANCPWWLVAGMIMAVAYLLGGAGKLAGPRLAVPGGLCVAAVALAGLWAGGSLGDSWLVVWVVIVVAVAAATWMNLRGALLPTTVCLIILFGTGLWNDSMVTLAMTLVATFLVMILGVVIGVWMGRSSRVDSAVRPFLDLLQTMPPFVYLVPALALFPPGRFLAIAAAILYAAPIAIKIAADGIRAVSPTTVEAARASGSSPWQTITKVQLPMSKGAMVLAANQGLLYVLSVVVIGGLVGGGGLGFLVVNGFSQSEDFGKGLAAGIAITALGVMLDRITVNAAARYGKSEAA